MWQRLVRKKETEWESRVFSPVDVHQREKLSSLISSGYQAAAFHSIINLLLAFSKILFLSVSCLITGLIDFNF